MTESELVQYFDYFLQNYQIQTQIMRRDTKLYIMLNRPAGIEMDYPFLTEAIVEQLKSLPLDGIQTVTLNSRILGETAPDWKTAISLAAPEAPTSVATPSPPQQASSEPHPQGSEPRSRGQTPRRSSSRQSTPPASGSTPSTKGTQSPPKQRTGPEPTHTATQQTRSEASPPAPTESQAAFPRGSDSTSAEAAGSPTPPAASSAEDTPALDLSSYCFVRNQLLIKTSLPDPDPEVAAAVHFFHKLPEAQKAEVAPLLVKFFKQPETYDLEELPEDQQEWLSKIQALNEQKLKSVAVWLSRYCADADRALTQINATLKIFAPQQVSRAPAPAGTDQARSTPSGQRSYATGSGSAPTGSQTAAPSGSQTAAPGSQTAGSTTGARRSTAQRSAKPPKSAWQRIALPIVGACLAVVVILGGVWVGFSSYGSSYCHPPSESATSQDQDRYHLCLLTSRMVGDGEMASASRSATRLQPEPLQQIPNLCSQEANSSDFSLFWGEIADESYRVAEVMPGLYAIDLEQQFQGGTRDLQRYGCVFRGTANSDLALVDSDRLPRDWPETPYSPSTTDDLFDLEAGSPAALGGLGPFFFLSLGAIGIAILGALFVVNLAITAFSFYVISRMELGINIYSMPDLLVGSLVFTIWSGVIGSIPFLGFFASIVADVIALLLTGWMVKGFRVDIGGLLMLSVLLLWGIRFMVFYVLILVFGSLLFSLMM